MNKEEWGTIRDIIKKQLPDFKTPFWKSLGTYFLFMAISFVIEIISIVAFDYNFDGRMLTTTMVIFFLLQGHFEREQK